jgi:uncharacterized protein (DUF2141 family)
MKKLSVLALALFYFNTVFAQSDTLEVTLDIVTLTQSLNNSPHEINTGVGQVFKSEQLIYLPITTGESKAFKLIEYDILPAALRKEIKTFYGYMLDDANVKCRLTIANGQISANLTIDGKHIAIEKNNRLASSNTYLVYEAIQTPSTCEVERKVKDEIDNPSPGNSIMFNSHGTQLRTYRLALLVTNAFYTAGGGNDAAVNLYVASIINNINGIYEKEIAVRFRLVSPNNPTSSNVFYNYAGATDLNTVHNEVTNRFGNSNYDVGHVLLPSGGGVAGLGVVCNSFQKGAGLSGVSSANDILIFAHELGHQFDADHTFNGNGSGNCGPSNRGNNDAYEPGSGNTIMSYATICTPEIYNLIGGKVPYFHTRSQTTMISYITNAGCGTIANTNNAVPVVAALTPVTIPKNTPFLLSGAATDANGDPLNYTWEQYDLAAVSDTGSLGNTPNNVGTIAVNSTSAPLFRTRQSTSGTRSFPDILYVLNNANNPDDKVGEDLPNVSRTISFRLTVRDSKAGGGGVAFQQVAVTVANSGPLAISSFNVPTTIAAGSTQTISWNRNGTEAISANVKISLSVDGGNTFPFILIASTPNDGSQVVNFPTNVVATTNARIKVSSLHHPTAEFFDINNAPITVTSGCLAISNFICPDNAISANQGAGSLNLNVAGSYLGKLSGGTKTISFTEALQPMYVYSDASKTSCHEAYSTPGVFLKFRVSKTGTYAVNASTDVDGSTVSTVYNSGTFNCSSFVSSNAHSAISWSGSYLVQLNECTDYWVSGNDVFGGNNNVMISVSGSGDVFEILTAPAGFSYTYTAVSKANNQIAAISSTANFTTLGAGNYDVVGLAYENSFNLNTIINQTTAQAYGTGSCLLFSGNSKRVTVVGVPCPSSLTLVAPTDNIASGTIKQEVSGAITATNKVTGGNVKYDAGQNIQLNPGFTVDNGVVFSAYIDGCGGQ